MLASSEASCIMHSAAEPAMVPQVPQKGCCVLAESQQLVMPRM